MFDILCQGVQEWKDEEDFRGWLFFFIQKVFSHFVGFLEDNNVYQKLLLVVNGTTIHRLFSW